MTCVKPIKVLLLRSNGVATQAYKEVFERFGALVAIEGYGNLFSAFDIIGHFWPMRPDVLNRALQQSGWGMVARGCA